MKIIKTGEQARSALKAGIDLVANCVRVTLGPTGRNAVLGRHEITPYITNDGVSIAREIEADDPIENQGVWVVKEAAMLADLNGGDGTTTTTVLLQKIVDHAFKLLADDGAIGTKKPNAIALKRQIDAECEAVVKKLTEMSRPITPEEIYDVALVSGEYEWLAKLIESIFKEVGKDGYVTVEEGVKTGFEVFKGIEVAAGYNSDYFINADKRMCRLQNPKILVTNQKLDVTAMIPVVEELAKRDIANLIIIAPDFTPDLLSRLITTKLKTEFMAVAVKLPASGNDAIFKDIATLTQAKFLDKSLYPTYDAFKKDVVFDALGEVERAEISESKTLLIGGRGDTTERVKEIRHLWEQSESVFDKDEYEKRIAYLSGGIGVVRVWAESDTEKRYYKLKAEDAVNAVREALRDGVVKGGGLALASIAESMSPGSILRPALCAPYDQIQENAGGQLDIGEKVIDPVKITISALKAACSLAGTLITTEVVVAPKKDLKTNHADPEV